jgi:hypothetical protein
MPGKSHHVVLNPNGGWSVIRTGASRATKRFARKQDAIDWASLRSRQDGSELIVHKRDGMVESKSTHRDRQPPQDRS